MGEGTTATGQKDDSAVLNPASAASVIALLKGLLTQLGGGASPTPVPITSQTALPAGTSRSGSITTGGTAQDLAAENTSRKSLTGQNISSGDLWVNENGGAAAADSIDAYKVIPGASFKISTNEKVSIVGATTGQKFTATET